VLSPLRNPVFARLFAAQLVALLGTGLLTVALALLAYELAGDRAGAVLGTALAIKMVAYVGLAPVTQALAGRLPRKAVLVVADLVRAGVALLLPFVSEVWQVYLLILLLQSASATFTPAFQATIPDVLPDEGDYTRALSLSRLAYELENLASPALAAALLTVVTYSALFLGTVAGFLASAALVRAAALPAPRGEPVRPFRERLTRGIRIYLATPRLRGLLAVSFATAAAGAFVLVNTVVLVRAGYGGGEGAVAVALGAFGAGSAAAALALPRLLERLSDRPVMLGAAALLGLAGLGPGIAMAAGGLPTWGGLLALWALTGAAYAAALTPSGRLLRASAHPEDRPAVFAAQFALSHACWLLTYPLAGWAGTALGLGPTLALLGLFAGAGAIAAARLWRADEPEAVAHDHADLPPDHPHLRAHGSGASHVHRLVIDDLHPAWPGRA
jgi:MFS family permease